MNGKIIFIKQNLYQVYKETEKHLFIHPLLIKLDDNIEAKDYEYDKVLNLEDVNFKLYCNKVNNAKFKLLKTENYEVVDDVDDVYVLNGKLYKNLKNEPFYRHMFKYQFMYNYNYYMKLLNNESIKKDNDYHKCKLIEFIEMFSSDIEIIKQLPSYNEFIKLKGKYNTLLLEDKLKTQEICLICWENTDVYNGFYNCCHNICVNCYDKWTNTCPMCRSNIKTIVTMY